jgi:uncharacterized Zn finger protein (UPF0148 family)
MNNCPKCGNPLQEGTNNCPICGTNILENNATTEAETPSVPAPPQPAPAPEAPISPAPEAPAATQEAQANPAVQVMDNTQTGILPTVDRVESPTPIPSIPSSLSDNTVGLTEEKPLVANPKLEPKKPVKKTPIIVGAILIIVLGIGCFMFLKPAKTVNKGASNNGETPKEEIALSSMSSNGYHLKVAEGWAINEDGTNVILTNNDGTVAIKLEHSAANLASIEATQIEDIMNSNGNYQDVNVSEVDVSGRSSFLVSTNINSLPVQIYFINGGPELIIGATIVYQSNDTKDKYEATVMEMIVSLSYTDDSIKAIEAMSEYSQMFGIFNNVTYNATNNYSYNNNDNNNENVENQNEETQNNEENPKTAE